MKKRITLSYLLLAGLVMVVVMFTGSCKKLTNPTEGTKIIINYDHIETYFSVKIFDAATDELIGLTDNKKVTLKVSGQHADAVIDISGMKKSEYTTNNGILQLAIDPDYSPSASNPIKFTLIAYTEGYMSTSKLIIIKKNEKLLFDIRMVDLGNTPEGVSKVTDNNGIADPEGKVTEELVITTPNGAASLVIPQGTILKTNEGNPLTGQLEVMLIHFSNRQDESLKAFPGGLNTNILQQDETYTQVQFFSAGFIALDIWDASGSFAEKVEINPLQLNMLVPEETYNSNTESAIVDGDTIPVWSYNQDNGAWAYETTDTIFQTNKGGFEVSTEMWHLSWWNWDWWWEWVCEDGLQINFITEEYYCPCYWWEANVYNSYNNTFMMNSYFYACYNEPVIFYNAPGGFPVNIYYSSNCSGVYTESDFYYYDNLCAPDILDVTFYTEIIGSTLPIEISGYCASNPNIIIRPTLGYWIRKIDDWCFRWFEVVNGSGELCGIEIGETYVIGIYLEGEWFEYEFTADNESFVYIEIEFPPEVCAEVFGL